MRWMLILVVAMVAPPAWSQPTDEAAAQAAIRDILDKPFPWPNLDGLRIEFDSINTDKASPEEMNALRQAVARNPKKHPDAGRLLRLEAGLRGMPSTKHYRHWWRGEDEFRESSEGGVGSSLAFNDTVVTRQYHFCLNPSCAMISGTGTEMPPGYDRSGTRDEAARLVRALVYGLGDSLGHTSRTLGTLQGAAEIQSLSPELRFILRSSDGKHVVYATAEWPGTGRLRVRRVEWEYKNPAGIVEKSAETVNAASLVSGFDQLIGTEYTLDLGPDFRRKRVLKAIVNETISFETLTRVPKYGQEDAVRGGIEQLPYISDDRGGHFVYKNTQSGIETTEYKDLPSQRAKSRVTVLGWLLPPLAIMVVIGFVVWKRRMHN